VGTPLTLHIKLLAWPSWTQLWKGGLYVSCRSCWVTCQVALNTQSLGLTEKQLITSLCSWLEHLANSHHHIQAIFDDCLRIIASFVTMAMSSKLWPVHCSNGRMSSLWVSGTATMGIFQVVLLLRLQTHQMVGHSGRGGRGEELVWNCKKKSKNLEIWKTSPDFRNQKTR
jgi:hypothetical protein